MNELIEKLLQPISAEQPCGPDLSGDPRYDELAAILKGTPEVYIGTEKTPAKPPEWIKLQKKSVEFLQESKHLRVAMMLCCGLLKTQGFAGFRDGLQLIQGLVEQYWATLHPLLDPEDHNDPTQRMNILSALTQARGAFGVGWLTLPDYLYAAPICAPKGMPPVTFDQLLAAKRTGAGGAQTEVVDSAKLAAALRDAGSAALAAQQQVLKQSLDTVRSLDQSLTAALGTDKTISFDNLEQSLQEMLVLLNPYLTGSEAASAKESGVVEDVDNASEAGTAATRVKGSIRSSNEVVQALDLICEYYRQVEPSSPVPYLLRRAQKLAKMDFVQAVQELNLATVDSLRPSMGSAVPPTNPPGDQPPAQT